MMLECRALAIAGFFRVLASPARPIRERSDPGATRRRGQNAESRIAGRFGAGALVAGENTDLEALDEHPQW
jgi:hypothetical protein